jgi:TPP-dependent indolepyruvate ferredoxin oxidoreductase alpha subunit
MAEHSLRQAVHMPVTDTAANVIAQAIYDAGVTVLTYVPATGGQAAYNRFCQLSPQQQPLSFHEEVAFTIAHGAALTGRRSCAVMKGHGLAKAANSVVDSLSAGVTAGLVLVILEDPTGAHSDSILDSALLLDGMGVLYREGRMERIYEDILESFVQSERMELPCAIIVNTDEIGLHVSYSPGELAPSPCRYIRNITRHVLCPAFAAYQYALLQAKKSDKDRDAVAKPDIPFLPDTLPTSWQTSIRRYMPLFSRFREIRGDVVTADTGITCLFACPPFDCVDITTYIGGSIPLAIGACLAGHRSVWAITGDFSFIAAGHLGLLEAIGRNIPLKVLILCNGQAETTGGQRIPEGTLERILRSYQAYTRYIKHPGDENEVEAALRVAAAAKTLAIVVVDYRNEMGEQPTHV